MKRQKYYIKATLDDGVSGYDNKFKYHLGENVHLKPDMKSNSSCGRGIHLARNILSARGYVKATEFYLATAGKILGEDNTKIRTDKCNLLCRIPDNIIKAYDEAELSARKAYDKAVLPDWMAYVEAELPDWKAYEEAEAPAWKAYNGAELSAQRQLVRRTLRGLK